MTELSTLFCTATAMEAYGLWYIRASNLKSRSSHPIGIWITGLSSPRTCNGLSNVQQKGGYMGGWRCDT